MNPRLITLAIVTLILPAMAQRPTVKLSKTRTLGTPVQFRNLTVFPVYDSAARPQNKYLTVDEGLKSRALSVREKQGGGQVNTVLVTNRGRKPIYLMSGEVILGGQQDRIIGDDTIVPPQARNLPVRVYCVEHGRWSGRGEFAGTAVAAAAPSVRQTAQEGAFMSALAESPAFTATNGRAVRLEAQQAAGRSQQEVWDKVAAKNKAFKATPGTGTYREVLNMKGGESGRSVTPYLTAISTKYPKDRKVVGAVAAINGKVIAADVFGDPILFRKLWPKLLKSYASEAAESSSAPPARAVTAPEAAKFVADAGKSRNRTETRSAAARNERYDSKDARAYRLLDRSERAPAGAAVTVPESVIRK